MPRATVTAPDAPEAIGPYVHAVRASGELLFVSGQIPLDPNTGELVGETPAEQARQALTNLAAVIKAAGASLSDAVKVTLYTTDLSQFAAINEVYAQYFKDSARAALGVAALPKGALVEVEAVVVLPEH
ncbi:MAG: RidA family protein [Solirubrobacterales bacterium]|nr:RidA family protein [Solirubrobacterales bacterium]